MKRCSKEAWARCPDREGCEPYAEFTDGCECDRFNEKIMQELDGRPVDPRLIQPIEWIPAGDPKRPADFVPVLACMADAGPFPPVRESYTVNGRFYFPALCEFHPITHWAEMPGNPKGAKKQ